jgi:hypothetical protein
MRKLNRVEPLLEELLNDPVKLLFSKMRIRESSKGGMSTVVLSLRFFDAGMVTFLGSSDKDSFEVLQTKSPVIGRLSIELVVFSALRKLVSQRSSF